MDKEQIKPLIEKYLNGTASDEESVLVETWYNTYQEEAHPELSDDMIVGAVDRVEERLSVRDRKVRLWPRVAVAAAAVAAIVVGVWFYSNEVASSRRAFRNEVTQNDIAPGKHTAMLTLASGRKINLSDAKTGVVLNTSRFAYDDGSAIEDPVAADGNAVNSKTGSWNEVSTPKGGTYKVILPDGTNVWLNAASSLRFPNRFIDGRRYVQLTGEAYFEVAKDRVHPFIVSSWRQQIEVLGTHFNVSTYPEEKTATTTLIEGSITINNVLLKPNQEAVRMGKGGLIISNVEASDAMAWKDGKFRFNNTDLDVVLRQLGRWYDVDIRYIGKIPDRKFTGGIDRNINASEALDILKYLKVNFKIEGKTIIVSK